LQDKPFLSLPASAVTDRDGKKVAFRVTDNAASAVSLTTGRLLGSSIEIIDGLTVGEKVIDNLGPNISDGVKVKIQ